MDILAVIRNTRAPIRTAPGPMDAFGISPLYGDRGHTTHYQAYSNVGRTVTNMMNRLQKLDNASYHRVRLLAADLCLGSGAIHKVDLKNKELVKSLNLDVVDNFNSRVSTLVVGIICNAIAASQDEVNLADYEKLMAARATLLGWLSLPALRPVFYFLIRGLEKQLAAPATNPADNLHGTDAADMAILKGMDELTNLGIKLMLDGPSLAVSFINAHLSKFREPDLQQELIDALRQRLMEAGIEDANVIAMFTTSVEGIFSAVPEKLTPETWVHFMAAVAFQTRFHREAAESFMKEHLKENGLGDFVVQIMQVNTILTDMFLRQYNRADYKPAEPAPARPAKAKRAAKEEAAPAAGAAPDANMVLVATAPETAKVAEQVVVTDATKPSLATAAEGIRNQIILVTDWRHAKAEVMVSLFVADARLNMGVEEAMSDAGVKAVLAVFNKLKKTNLLRDYMDYRASGIRAKSPDSEFVGIVFDATSSDVLEAQVNQVITQLQGIVGGVGGSKH